MLGSCPDAAGQEKDAEKARIMMAARPKFVMFKIQTSRLSCHSRGLI